MAPPEDLAGTTPRRNTPMRVVPLLVLGAAILASIADAGALDLASLLAGRLRHPDPLTPELVRGHLSFLAFLAVRVFPAYVAALALAAWVRGAARSVVVAVAGSIAARFAIAWLVYPGRDSVVHALVAGDPTLFVVPAVCAAGAAAACAWVRARAVSPS